jgi:hypothetical protein
MNQNQDQDREITNEEFDLMLLELLMETHPLIILRVPGVYEILAEHFNNEVLERWERWKEKYSSSI